MGVVYVLELCHTMRLRHDWSDCQDTSHLYNTCALCMPRAIESGGAEWCSEHSGGTCHELKQAGYDAELITWAHEHDCPCSCEEED